ncbi:MAG: PSD1 and planctomycete cytochrome C domain-containing protein [Planctomycetaceae bacterium]|nr:PSD1 and planctomycete cytochrome C domain-containing protein [Planctomycetaceae bacterium]
MSATSRSNRRFPKVSVAAWLAVSLAAACRGDEPFFETEIRPLLIARCVKCHGGGRQEGGLRLDTRAGLLAGGESGQVIEPKEPLKSRLLEAVGYAGDLQMPPDEKLSDREITALTTWIKLGAPWPETEGRLVSPSEERARRHWAFQPVVEPSIPNVTSQADWIRTPVDAFILSGLQSAGLSPSPEADRRTLIRRLTQTLTGLPPSMEEVAAFENSTDPLAYEQLVERLLESPHYGEQWGRRWLDIARYSDTKGYVYAREERFWVHAWAYRDWVVRAFHQNLPYDRFLMLQLAADQVTDRQPGDLAAMGFLTLGRRFLGVPHDIIDDRIDVVTRGTMALTVGCARCHDHKYDPIPTADYYSLYGVFSSSSERLAPLNDPSKEDEAFQKELQTRQEKLAAKLLESRNEAATRVRGRIGDYLVAQTELHKYPPQGFDQVFEKTDIIPSFVRQWERFLIEAERRQHPVFVPWLMYAQLPGDQFPIRAAETNLSLQEMGEERVNPIVLKAFTTPPASFREVVDRYAAILVDIETRWQAAVKDAAAVTGTAAPQGLPDPAAEQLRRILYGPGAPCEVPDEPVVHVESFFDLATCTELWKLQGEVDRWILNSGQNIPYALTLVDQTEPLDAHILKRGNSLNKGDLVPRQFLSLIAGEQRRPFQQGSGRLELAQAITSPLNPLTARVLVNRVWAAHFGRGLVPTTSDFGLRADEPSHPQLLDWLAARFVAEGWNLKELQRWMLLSATFRQSSAGPPERRELARALQLDPENRRLWRMNPKRRTFEEFRDAALAAGGEIDLSLGGKPANLFAAPFPKRRTIYGLVDRQYLPGTFRVFDFANPDLHIPQRSETTVPQQALFFLNHPMMLERVKAIAAVAKPDIAPAEVVRTMFRQTLQRGPTDAELAEALELVTQIEPVTIPQAPPTAAEWKYGYGQFDDVAKQVAGFTPLPHFTGQAWQGGPAWPDAKLGWVQLTADGGHPGNDRQHASVRRWTAPRPMTLAISTKLVHEPAPGDGIRAFIVSSTRGLLASTSIHQKAQELNVDPRAVAAGETIDFVVDIGDVLNSDQYLWSVSLSDMGSSGQPVTWDSRADFTPGIPVPRLNGWEQMAQVLLCTNEFLFID